MTTINRAAVVGVGGVGSSLLQPLASLLANQPEYLQMEKRSERFPKLLLIDGDEYEEKNLRNQCIQVSDVGRNKAQVAAEMVAGLRLDVDAWDEYLTGPLALAQWLVEARTEQAEALDAGRFGGVVLLVLAVDNDHARKYIYDAIEEVPNVSVLVVDPSNGAGDDADEVDVYTFLRVNDGTQMIEPWLSPATKFKQLAAPPGRDPNQGCHEKAVSQPQLRTSNMRAALYAYDAVERFVSERGLPEGYAYSDEHGERRVGDRLPTVAEMEALSEEVTEEEPLPLDKWERMGAEMMEDDDV